MRTGRSGAMTAQLAELIRESSCTVALTGAGVSVPSGIPDFRTQETGVWANVDPMEVAHIEVFESDPARFWSYYRPRFHSLGDKRPHASRGGPGGPRAPRRVGALNPRNLRPPPPPARLEERGRGARLDRDL